MTRVAAVNRIRARLQLGYWPRLHCLLLINLATAAACLVSVVLLWLGAHSMSVRYALAALCGYLCFAGLIRGWVRWKWSHMDFTGEGDFGPSRDGNAAGQMFSGGRSGGGGASGSWGSSTHSPGSGGGGISLDLDADDLVWLIVALLAAVAGFAAVGYVIWIAPEARSIGGAWAHLAR